MFNTENITQPLGDEPVAPRRQLQSGVTLVKRYHIQEVIGVGGMGSVYRARDLHFPNVIFFFFISRYTVLVRDLSRSYASETESRQFRGAHDVLADHVDFEVDAVAKRRTAQVRVRHRERHNLHVEPIGAEARHGQADAVDRDRSLVHEIAAPAAAES